MTLTSTTQRLSFFGDDTTTGFTISFYFIANADITAILRDSDGGETTWVLDTDYTLTGAGVASGGTLTATTAPASGETLIIKRVEQLTQPNSLPLSGSLPSATLEEMADRLTMIVQQIDEKLGRAPLFSDTSSSSGLTLPDPEAGKLVGWNSGGTDFANFAAADVDLTAVSSFIQTLFDDTTAAAARTTLGGISEVSDDTTPTLGGNLDIDGNAIVSTSNGDIAITPDGTGQVKPGETNLQDSKLIRPKIEDYSETVNAIGSISTSTEIDIEDGNVQTLTVTGGTPTLSFTNWPASGTAGSVTLIITDGGAGTVTWAAACDWPGGTAPSLTASGRDWVVCSSIDAGTTIDCFTVGQDMS